MAVHLLERGTRIRSLRSRREQHGVLALLRHLDVVLLGSTLALVSIGVVMVYSATRNQFPEEPTYYLKRQILYATIGVGVMLVTMFVDYRRLNEWGLPLYGFVVCSLLAVFVIGNKVTAEASGATVAQRWIAFGPFEFQPSEFGVLAIVVALGAYLSQHGAELTPKRLLGAIVLAGVPMLLVYKQPDLGTTIVMAVVLFSVLVVAGVRLRYLALGVLGAALLVLAAFGLGVIHSFQIQRLTCFFHPNAPNSVNLCYQLNVTETAIGAGQFRGTGLFHGAVTSLNYVPEQYADSIFATIGEQLGFVGSAVILGLFGLVALRIFRAIQVAGDLLGRVICGGALAFLVFSVFQNVGMNVGIMPITGIPLPFISYGGSALLAFFAAIGLVMNVEMRRRSFR